MKIKKKKWLSAFAIGCALCVGVGIASLSQTHAGAEIVECNTTAIETVKTNYLIGESVVVPQAKIVYDGREITPTETYMLTPDGQANTASEYELNQAGIYTIVYVAKENGKTLKAEKAFTVEPFAYGVESNLSSVEYTDTLTMLDCVADDSKLWNHVTYGKGGIQLTLAQGDTFTYYNPINLNDFDGSYNFLHIFPWQRNDFMEGWRDLKQAEQLYVRLTDCYNPDVYVEYLLNWQSTGLYYRVGTHEQASVGLDANNLAEDVIYIDGARKRVFTNKWGVSVRPYTNYVRPYGHRLSFDVQYNKAYVISPANDRLLINALNSPFIYEDETTHFKGFTTGEVYLSIYGEAWEMPYANIDISSIGGLNGSALNFDTVKDNSAPTIQIENNLDNYGEIKIAFGESFQIPLATAYDINLSSDVKTAVYYNYGKDGQSRVATNDNVFTPNRLGNYTVIYTAKDAYGQKTVKTLDLQCVKTVSGLGIDFAAEKVSALYAGREITLPAWTATGLNKAVQVQTYYIRKDADGNEIERVDIVDNTFIPYYTGTYTIVYEYTDGVKNYSYSYDTVCNSSDTIAMMETPVLPKYLAKGYMYTFEKFYVYTFAGDEPKANLTTLQMSVDGGEFTTVAYEDVAISATESVRVRYQFEDWTSAVYEMRVVNIGTNGTLNMQELFQGDVAKSSAVGYVSYEALGTGDITLDYINPISASHFNFKYDIPKGYDKFDSLVITLTDYYDSTNTVEISYYKNEQKNTVYNVNGREDVLISAPEFFGVIRNCFYIPSIQTFTDTAGISLEYPMSFKSDKVFLSVTMKGVIGASMIRIREVNNQSLSNLNVDIKVPEAYLTTAEGGVRELGSQMTLYPLTVIDAITPVGPSNVAVTVRGPDKKPVKDVNGNVISGVSIFDGSYTLTLAEYGTYVVTYRYSDQAGNESTLQFTIVARDTAAPVLEISDDKTTSAKVNEAVEIASYVVSDNISEESKIISFVSLITPKGEVLNVLGDDVNAFVPTYAGVWKVCYYVCDEAGNHVMETYEVVVK